MKWPVVLLVFVLTGCASFLPQGSAQIDGPWQSYDEAQQAFDKIVPYQTTLADLKGLKLDPHTNPNITILTYSDVLQRFLPNASVDVDSLDKGVCDCINAKTACKGYEVTQKSIKRNRVGNFFVDFLNFRREVDVTGWSFKGMLLVKDTVVIYKLSGGQPIIHEQEANKNPLGPLQGAGDAAVRSAVF
jgi:hypothetical protein